MKRTMMSLMAATALGSLAFTLPTTALASGLDKLTTPAITSTSIIAKHIGTYDPTLKTSTVLLTKSVIDTKQFGASKSILAYDANTPATKHFMAATDQSKVSFGGGTGKKTKVTDTGWAAVLGTKVGLKAFQAQAVVIGKRDLKSVAWLDGATNPVIVRDLTRRVRYS